MANSLIISNTQEYLIVNPSFQLLELSENAKKYAENPETIGIGKDIRLDFPEIIGLEDILINLSDSPNDDFVLDGIAREKKSNYSIYFNIKAQRLKDNIIFFLEDATELMLLKQSLNQKINDAEISLEALKRFEYCTNKIIDSMADILLICNYAGVVKRTNKAMNHALNYSASEVVNKNISEIINDIDFDHNKVFQSLELEKNSTQKLEFNCTPKNTPDRKITIEFNCFLAPTEVKQIFNCVYIGRDITIRKKAEAEIRQALEKEQELRALKSSFISMASHEFRNPLSGILVCADVLIKTSEKLDLEESQFYLNLIKESALNMQYLLEDVLVLSKTESAQQKLDLQSFSLAGFCHQVIEALAISYQNRVINLIVTNNNLEICADQKLLWHILNNLLSNALKYSADDKAVDLEVVQQENTIILEIRDRGIGIPPEAQKNLFESFYRAGNVGDIPGTGLGLAIVKRAIDLHQGTISVESKPELGTNIKVGLPINPNII